MRNCYNRQISNLFYCLAWYSSYSTRDEKIKSLEAAQTKYKSESILLDQQNNEMRKKLRSLTVSMQAAGKSMPSCILALFTFSLSSVASLIPISYSYCGKLCLSRRELNLSLPRCYYALICVSILNSLPERDRDWLLSRLRKAKKIYSTLESGAQALF